MSKRAQSRVLAQSPLFQTYSEGLSTRERVKLSYDRAKAIVDVYKLTAHDILHVTDKYWEFHTDPILVMDGAVGTLLTIHYNLCAGTLARYASRSPEIQAVLDDLLAFRTSGQYCLTEVGHGLDAANLETTAHLQPDGMFILNTPHVNASKFMPPTVPAGIPTVSVIFARLIVNDEDRGIRPFLVPLHNGHHMHEGVQTKILLSRGGSHPVDHALTFFRFVRLPHTALLGDIAPPSNRREAFFSSISRVISGTLSMGAFGVSAIELSSHVGAKYSLRRTVTDSLSGSRVPIISFSTQFTPVLSSLAYAKVFRAYSKAAREAFISLDASLTQKHCTAAIFKATIMKHAKSIPLELGDRCGAQGLFSVNQLSSAHANMRGASIAEGDLLGISIRFAMDILLGKAEVPSPVDRTSPLYLHESSLIKEMRTLLASSKGKGHRSSEIQHRILPRCQMLLETIGYRVGYESAVRYGVERDVLDLYLATVLREDEAWFVEKGGYSRDAMVNGQIEAAVSLLPRLDELVDGMGVESYISAPIVSDEKWNAYTKTLVTYEGYPVHPEHPEEEQEKARL